MRQLIRTKREKEPHLSCGSCLSGATFTGLRWAGRVLEGVILVWVRVQAGSPQSRGQPLGPKGCAGYGGSPRHGLWSRRLL